MFTTYTGDIKYLPRKFYHDPLMTCEDGWTVAMYAAVNECIRDLPLEFQHSSLIVNGDGKNIIDMLVGL